MKEKGRLSKGILTGIGVLVSIIIGLWFLRPLGIIHGIIMFFYTNPLTWMMPALTILMIVIITILWVRRKKEPEPAGSNLYFYSYRRKKEPWEVATIVGVFLVPFVFVIAALINPMLNGQATYDHYGPFDQAKLPNSAETRIMPRTVASVLARNGFASPTETLENTHIIQTDQGLKWTFGQSPDGIFRRISKKTAGSASLDANVTTRKLRFYKGQFQIAPGHIWSDGITWKAYKKNYFSNISESIYLPGPGGGKILVHYIEYEGFFAKVPVLGGAYLISPNGTMKDLTPKEAASNPYVINAGRLFPEELARSIQDSFVYVNGIWNRIFTHRDVLVVKDRADSDANNQPHYISVNGRGEWVSVGEPWGRADAVGGMFFTNAITGNTRLWRASRSAGLTSSRRAQDATESLAIPGVSFRAGDFRAIGPRPVLRNGKLLFLVSIIPKAASTVSKSVIIDPKTNKALEIFSHTDDPTADNRLVEYLRGENGDGSEKQVKNSDQGKSGSPALSYDEREVLENLLKQNQEQREALLNLLERIDK